MEKKIIFISKSVSNFLQIQDSNNVKKFALDYISHKKLTEGCIEHDISDNFLDYNERIEIFDKVRKFHDWYNSPDFKDFELKGVNLLGLLDRIELHTVLIEKLIQFCIIKNIIEIEKPDFVECPFEIKKIIEIVTKNNPIDIKINSEEKEQALFLDTVNYKKNLAGIPVSIKISKSKYGKIKNIIDKTISSTFGLWFDLKNKNKKTILLLEFSPSLYKELLDNLKSNEYNIITINQRRPVTLDKKSINILKKSNCKIISKDSILQKHDVREIIKNQEEYSKKINELWVEKEKLFSNIFEIDNLDFWSFIKDDFKQVYSKRINQYVESVSFTKKIFETINVVSILSLNDIGETERVFLKCKDNNVITFILEHGFQLMFEENKRFGTLSSYDSFEGNYFVWSDFQKQFIINNYDISKKRVISVGSPRHDELSKVVKTKQKKKSYQVLIAPTPITPIQGFDLIKFHEKFEKVVGRLCKIFEKYSNVDLIFKIHPRYEAHNNEIANIIKKYSKNSTIYFFNPVLDLLETSDLVITITPEGWGPSTIILEGMILGIPIMNIVLDKKFYEFDYVKQNAIITVADDSDLEGTIKQTLFDHSIRNKLVTNGSSFVEGFLKNYRNSSKKIADILKDDLKVDDFNNNTNSGL